MALIIVNEGGRNGLGTEGGDMIVGGWDRGEWGGGGG